MLLSKNKNLFSPGLWPCYYSKAKGLLYGISTITNIMIFRLMGLVPVHWVMHTHPSMKQYVRQSLMV